MTTLHGLLNLKKPSGMTSRDAINRVQRVLPRKTKIGHAGTLDPLADGVLVACIGSATRLIGYVQQMRKAYTGTFLLGRQSPTEDVEGEVEHLNNPPIPTRDQLDAAAAALVGRIEQRPPAFSALKVQGRRAYDLARAGKPVELAARPIDIYQLDVAAYDYPELTLDVRCGSGTYIRSLGRDLAQSLGTEAVMSALTRTAIGEFTLAEAVDPTQLDQDSLQKHLLPSIKAVDHLPTIVLSEEEQIEIGHGRTIPARLEGATGCLSASAQVEIVAVDQQGRLRAIMTRRGKDCLGPILNFPMDC